MARISVAELGAPSDVGECAAQVSVAPQVFESDLRKASRRIAAALGMREGPIRLSDGTFRVSDVAGLVRLSPMVELEVAPKFLAAGYETWREDFFAVAMLVRFGHVFPRDALLAQTGSVGDIADLIGHAMIVLFDRGYRKPLRVYRHDQWEDFEVTGDPLPETVALPHEDGFTQEGLRLERRNEFNAVIIDGFRSVLPVIRNTDVRRGVLARANVLAPQKALGGVPRRRRLPARHSAWQDLYDLSLDVVGGFGTRFSGDELLGGRNALPGYVLRSADAWEDLMRAGIRAGLNQRRVEKIAVPLGTRRRSLDGLGPAESVMVTPDVLVRGGGKPPFPIDAKYKWNPDGDPSVSAPDLYEALAFMKATGSDRALLLYPASTQGADSVGSTRFLQKIQVEAGVVWAAEVSVRGLANEGGFRRLSDGLAKVIVAVEAES